MKTAFFLLFSLFKNVFTAAKMQNCKIVYHATRARKKKRKKMNFFFSFFSFLFPDFCQLHPDQPGLRCFLQFFCILATIFVRFCHFSADFCTIFLQFFVYVLYDFFYNFFYNFLYNFSTIYMHFGYKRGRLF
jgi:hypothetical protein